MSECCFCGKNAGKILLTMNKSKLTKISNKSSTKDQREEMSRQLTHSPWRIDEDAEPGVSADPRGREIPGGKLGSYSGLSARHLFSPEAASIPRLPDVTSGAAAPVALLFLAVQALWFRRAGASCGGRGRGA